MKKQLSDLETTILCAEAMGLKHWPHYRLKECIEVSDDGTGRCSYIYQPLYDDTQAMALVKKFNLNICSPIPELENFWGVWYGLMKNRWGRNLDLNRAICECIARIQLSKNGQE